MSSVLADLAANTQFLELAYQFTGLPLVQICQQNPLRYSLTFSYGGTGLAIVTTKLNDPSPAGLYLNQADVITLTVKDFGCLVQQAWYFYSSLNPDAISVFEMFFTRGV